MSETPGVGAYDIENSKIQTSCQSITTFPKEIRLKDKSTKSPGPLEYSPQRDAVMKRAPVAVIPKEDFGRLKTS